MQMKTDKELWIDARCASLRVEFIETKEELFLYASAIYEAMIWGKKTKESNLK